MKCEFCGRYFKKNGIERHLNYCEKKLEFFEELDQKYVLLRKGKIWVSAAATVTLILRGDSDGKKLLEKYKKQLKRFPNLKPDVDGLESLLLFEKDNKLRLEYYDSTGLTVQKQEKVKE